MLRWAARPLDDADGYMVVAEEGEVGTSSFWGFCAYISREQYEDDWLPDVVRGIERRYAGRHGLRAKVGLSAAAVGYRGWPDLWANPSA